MRMQNKILGAAVLSVAFMSGACGKSASTNGATASSGGSSSGTGSVGESLGQGTPQAEELTMDSGSSSSASRDDVSTKFTAQLSDTQVANINLAITTIVGDIEAGVAATQPITATANEAVWVYDGGKGVTYRFTLAQAATLVFGWKGEAKASAAADSTYVTILAGDFLRIPATDSIAHRGAGSIGLDLTAFATVAAGTQAAITARGQLFISYRHGATGTMLRIATKAYTPDPSTTPATSLYLEGAHVKAHGTLPASSFVLAAGKANLATFLTNVGLTPDATKPESWLAHARRVDTLGGWGSAVVFGGVIPASSAYIARECWNAAQAVGYRRVWDCAVASSALDAATATCTLVDSVQVSADGSGLTTTADPVSTANFTGIDSVCFPQETAALKAEAAPYIAALKADFSGAISVSTTDSSLSVTVTAASSADASDSGATEPAAPPTTMPATDGSQAPTN